MGLSPLQAIAVYLEARELPPGLRFYDVGGQTLFAMYAASGGIHYAALAYLMAKTPMGAVDLGSAEGLREACGGRWYVLWFEGTENEEAVAAKVNKAIEALNG